MEEIILAQMQLCNIFTCLSPHFEPSACGTTLLTQEAPPSFVQYKEPQLDWRKQNDDCYNFIFELKWEKYNFLWIT